MISNANNIITRSESYTTWKPVYLLPHLYRKCTRGLSSRVQHAGCAHEKLAKSSLPMPNKCFCRWLMFDVVYWIGWLKCEEMRHICNLRSRGLSNMWKHHTQPQQPVTSFSCWSLAWSPTAVGWDPILQVTFVASQPMWLWDQLVFQHEKQVDLTSVRWGWSQDCRQAILNKSTQILEAVSLWPRRIELATWLWRYGNASCFRISSRYLSASNDDISPVRIIPPHNITTPPPKAVSIAFSMHTST